MPWSGDARLQAFDPGVEAADAARDRAAATQRPYELAGPAYRVLPDLARVLIGVRVSKIGKLNFCKILQIFSGLVLGCTSYGARPQARAVNLSLMINLVWKIFENVQIF